MRHLGVIEDLEEILASDRDLPSREMLETFLKNGKSLNFAALKEVVKVRKHGLVPVVYPQSKRSTSSYIERGHPKTEVYLKKGRIVPFMIRGSERFLPPNRFPPIWSWILKNQIVDVEFGPPFDAEETQTSEVRQALLEMGANPVDLIMARIGRLDWQRMHPAIRPLHQDIDKRFPVKRSSLTIELLN